ncbi:TlpA disulfide reductase family protein [uncultured Bacteroides sp.]|uniref:TlpA family protein disulfide reductase n=1 Tax=uncultured Bacteroides sp. TaxID=162156 RepID=UPI0025D018FC|nr:TlpA disulfide reductase family protein [uncultured Bacteroides sp.]
MRSCISILSLLLCICSMAQAKDRVIERPPFLAWSSNSIEVDKIVMSDTATMVYVKAYGQPKYWVKIATGSYLKDNDGTLYPVRRGVGITLDEEFWMPESGEAEFQLLFPPIPESVKSLDFSEGDFDGAYKIWGIQLDEKAFRKSPLPKEAVVHKINKKAELPVPEFVYGKATLKGKIVGFKQDMPTTGQLHLSDPIRWLNYAEEVTIEEDGTFQVQTDVITVTPATLAFPFAQIPCLLAPGKESTIIVNTAECTRQQSHLQKDSKPYGKKAYFGGYLAELQQELAENTIDCNLVDDYHGIIKGIAGKDINGVKDYFLDKRQATYKQIEESPMSRAAKNVLKSNTDITTTIALFMAPNMMVRAHIENQKLKGEEAKKYYQTAKPVIPDNYYDVLKEFSLNTSADLYAMEYAYGVGIFSSQKAQMEKTLGTDKGILFNMMDAFQYYRSIEDFSPLTTEQISGLEALPSPAYKEILMALNEKLLEKIELNKKKTGFTINKAGEVSNEELFPSIISKFRGHTLLVDFWATWCGPCRMANKAMAPMKEELKDKDIIYLYITGETSPEETWNNMISDIHGEHFRVTNEQWAFLMSNLNIRGVPTYFVIDPEGNITYKQTGFPGADTMKEKLMETLK